MKGTKRLGGGGKRDGLVAAKKALFAIVGRWYLRQSSTLVPNGDGDSRKDRP
jgi:hypothetical protein